MLLSIIIRITNTVTYTLMSFKLKRISRECICFSNKDVEPIAVTKEMILLVSTQYNFQKNNVCTFLTHLLFRNIFVPVKRIKYSY